MSHKLLWGKKGIAGYKCLKSILIQVGKKRGFWRREKLAGQRLSFPKRQILYSSKLKEFATDNLRFDENGRRLSKWVENIVGKGEIAHYEQFLLFLQCFQKTCTADT